MIWLILCAVVFLIDITLFSFSQYGWSLVILIANACLAYVMIPEVSEQVASTPIEIAIYYTLVYLGVGVAMSFVKWLLYIRKIGSEISEIRQAYDNKKPLSTDDRIANDFQRLASYIKDKACSRKTPKLYDFIHYDGSQPLFISIKDKDTLISYFTPSAKGQVDKITYWILLWPFIIIDTALRDILVNFGKHVATVISKLFGGISRAIIRNSIGSIEITPAPNSNILDETAARG